jgi:hypothetical protein
MVNYGSRFVESDRSELRCGDRGAETDDLLLFMHSGDVRHAVVALLCAACGRVGFDPHGDGIAAAGRPCGAQPSAPDPVTITGTTYRYTSFGNTRGAIAGVTVAAVDAQGAVLAQVTSSPQGDYALAIPTGGTAPMVSLRYTDGADYTTTVYPDAPLDRALAPTMTTLFALGDGPLWSGGSMASIYSTVGATLDATKSSMTIEAYDCAGVALEGVAVTVTPSPEVLGYTGPNGTPVDTLTTTALPDTLVVAFNAIPGMTHVTASKPGFTFVEQDVLVAQGHQNQVVVVRPVE